MKILFFAAIFIIGFCSGNIVGEKLLVGEIINTPQYQNGEREIVDLVSYKLGD